MRHKAGIAVAAGVALVLAAAAGAAARQYAGDDDRRPVGTWHEAPAAASTPVAQQGPAAGRARTSSAAPRAAAETPRPSTPTTRPRSRTILPESGMPGIPESATAK